MSRNASSGDHQPLSDTEALAIQSGDTRRDGGWGRLGGRAQSLLGPAIVLAVFLGIWYVFALIVVAPHRRFLVPPRHDVLLALIQAESRVELLGGLWQTTRVSLTGLAIVGIVGSVFAILMNQARWIERSFYPYAILLQVMPVLAVVPLIGLAFGFSFSSRVLVCVMVALFPVITNTLFGLKSVSSAMHDLFSIQHASKWHRFWKLEFPAAQPAIFTGLRISAGLSVVGAIVGDFFFRQGPSGLGVLLDRYRAQVRTEELYGAIFYAAALGLAVFFAFSVIARRVVGRWHDSYGEGQVR